MRGKLVIFYIIMVVYSIVGTFFYKRDKVITSVIFTLLAIIFTAVYGNADTQSYLLEYENMFSPDWTDTEPLWMLIQFFFRQINTPFLVFRLIIFTLAFCLIKQTISMITQDKNVILLLYAIYPFMLDCVQMRNFFAMAILIYGIGLLIQNNRLSILKYCFCVFLCTLIHNVFIIYILFACIPWMKYKKFITLLIAFFATLVIFMNRVPTIALMIFGNYHNGSYAKKYVTGGVVSVRLSIALLLFYSLNIILLLISVQIYRTAKGNDCIESEYEKKVVEFAKISMAGLVTFVLNLYSMDFSRLYRNVIPITYAIVWQATYYCRHKILLRLALVSMTLLGIYIFVYWPYPDTVFWPTLQNNYIFDFLSFS